MHVIIYVSDHCALRHNCDCLLIHIIDFFLTASTPKSNAFYGQGSGKIWLNSVHCTGFETRLVDCQFNSNTAGLTHQDDAGVICKHSGRL